MRPTPEYLATLTENTQRYIAELEAEVVRLRQSIAEQPCECIDEYGHRLPVKCDRCKALEGKAMCKYGATHISSEAAKETSVKPEPEMAGWQWVRGPDKHDGTSCWVLLDSRNNTRAQVWGGVWHTYNEDGTGGENDSEADDTAARVEAVKALKRAAKEQP